jgi:catechol 2,3-dioxygenase-like lactoylglutathione lyase family enzyme
MLTGLNHITIAVSNIERSLEFYLNYLGFKGHVKWDAGAYLSLGDLWFCLSLDQPDCRKDYTHIAFDVPGDKFHQISTLLCEAGVRQWKSNTSEGGSLYILDPDDHKLEIHTGSLQSRLQSLKSKPYKGLEWL